MVKEYSAEENRLWRAAQPQKMIVAKVIVKSDKHNMLLVKPNYKKTWQLPGGGVENGESPEAAVIREAFEELGLSLSMSNLILKGSVYKADEELLFLLYENNELISEDIRFKIQEGEIVGFQFVSINKVAPLLPEYYSDFWRLRYQ